MRLEIPEYSRYYLDTDDNNVYNKKTGHLMTETIQYNRYGKHPVSKITLVRDDGTSHNVFKHRVVYAAYHPDEDFSELQINHLDEDSMNNDIGNLETCTAKENMNWGTVGARISADHKGKFNNHASKPIIAYRLNPYKVERYPSISEAARQLGVCRERIGDVCKGYRVEYAGRIFQYER